MGFSIERRVPEREMLRELRKTAHMLTKELAAVVGVRTSYICDIEAGRRPLSRDALARMPPAIREPLVRARIGELRKLIVTDHLGRDEKDFAIEHAGYLADSVERMLQAQRSIIDAEEWLELHSLAYEFRKRVARIAELEKLL
jgi:transcriptional regulator with XRE-family HTH domain